MPEEGSGAACALQPEDEQLSEGDCRSVRNRETSQYPCGAALLCHIGLPGKWCEAGECCKNAGPLKYKDDPALC